MLLILEEMPVPVWFFPYNTSYELVKVSQKLFPAFMNGMRCIYGAFYVDKKAQLENELEDLQLSTKECSVYLVEISSNILYDPSVVKSYGATVKKESYIEKVFREQGIYHMDNTEAKEIVQRQLDLIADPKKLAAHFYDLKNEWWELFKYLGIYLTVRYIWKQISSEVSEKK